MNLDQTLIKEYQDCGVVVIRNIISAFWLEKLSIGIENINGSERKVIMRSIFKDI